MRALNLAGGEYYHLLNRGMAKRPIFHDNDDYLRFLFLITHLQSGKSFLNMSRDINLFKKTFSRPDQHRVLINQEYAKAASHQPLVKLLAFCLMPNHFHLLVLAIQDNGIARYLQRILNAYAKYYNLKYQQTGHLFQGPYRAVHVSDNEQLLYTSAYVHKNCCELLAWQENFAEYPWSSLQDYCVFNRWSTLLDPQIIIDQFDNPTEYLLWVKNNPAKTENFGVDSD